MATETSRGREEVAKRAHLADANFAGRVGGNQEFIATSKDSGLLNQQPDAVSYAVSAYVYTVLTASGGTPAVHLCIIQAQQLC